MLAGRLCLELGIDDPIAWLESVPAEVLSFWRAFDSIEPIGGSKFDAARIAYEIASLRHLFVAVHARENATLPKHPDFSEYMPARWIDFQPPKKEKPQSGFEIGKALMARFGG
jgi:hypothetical protein